VHHPFELCFAHVEEVELINMSYNISETEIPLTTKARSLGTGLELQQERRGVRPVRAR